jgi:hypothetical protein
MTKNKTTATEASVDAYLAAIDGEERRNDCAALARLMAKATKFPPKMWGTSVVGFGSYHYKYESGREGDSCLTGFSSRKGDISVYLTTSVLAQADLLAKLGRHKTGKGCLYIRRLAEIDLDVLERLVAGAVADHSSRHG